MHPLVKPLAHLGTGMQRATDIYRKVARVTEVLSSISCLSIVIFTLCCLTITICLARGTAETSYAEEIRVVVMVIAMYYLIKEVHDLAGTARGNIS